MPSKFEYIPETAAINTGQSHTLTKQTQTGKKRGKKYIKHVKTKTNQMPKGKEKTKGVSQPVMEMV